LLELEADPDAPPVLLPDVPASPPPQSFAANCGSVGFRFAHFADLLFWPEREAAGVFVAFSCDAPELLMCCCALSRPVDLLDFEDDLPLLEVLASSLLLLPEEVPVPESDPEPPSLLVVPELLRLPDVPLLLVPLVVPAVDPLLLIEEPAALGVVLLLDGDEPLLP
jgi:hypothetical protein